MKIRNKNSYTSAKKRVKKIKSFYSHLIVYLIINLLFIIKNTSAIGWSGFKNTITTVSLFWGIGLLFHWYSVFGKNIFFSKSWEENKIKELMEKDKSDNFN